MCSLQSLLLLRRARSVEQQHSIKPVGAQLAGDVDAADL
jgi:hypothetical protein